MVPCCQHQLSASSDVSPGEDWWFAGQKDLKSGGRLPVTLFMQTRDGSLSECFNSSTYHIKASTLEHMQRTSKGLSPLPPTSLHTQELANGTELIGARVKYD